MNHPAALGYSADGAGFAAGERDAHRNFLFHGVGRHNRLGRRGGAVLAQAVHERLHPVLHRRKVNRLPDNAGGRHHDVAGGNAGILRHKRAHGLGLFHTVGVAGVRNAAVADDRLRLPVLQVFARDDDRRAADEVLRIHRRRVARHVGDDEHKVFLFFIFADAAVQAVGPKAPGRGHAAFFENFDVHETCSLF